MNRYIKIDKEDKKVVSIINSDVSITKPAETSEHVWEELDASFDNYLISEVIVNADLTISPNSTARDIRVESERMDRIHKTSPTVNKQLYALKKSRESDDTLLNEVDAEIDAVVDKEGEPTY